MVWSVFFQFYQNVCLLLSLCMHISLIFHKVVLRRIYSVMGSIIITLSQIVRRVCQWKNFENRSIIGEVMDKSKEARFLAHPVYSRTELFRLHEEAGAPVAVNIHCFSVACCYIWSAKVTVGTKVTSRVKGQRINRIRASASQQFLSTETLVTTFVWFFVQNSTARQWCVGILCFWGCCDIFFCKSFYHLGKNRERKFTASMNITHAVTTTLSLNLTVFCALLALDN